MSNTAIDYFQKKHSFGQTERYKKQGMVLFRPAQINETVLTMTVGKLETLKQAEFGDVVVRNYTIGTSAEQYIIGSNAKFLSRYEPTDKTYNIDGVTWGMAKATGEVEAVEYHGGSFIFPAPWGEDMECNNGDFLCKLPEEGVEKVYRIERDSFFETYKLKDELAVV